MTEATREGVSTEGEGVAVKGLQPDLARFNQIEEMAANLNRSREEDIQELLEADPGFRAREQAVASELAAAAGTPLKEEEEGGEGQAEAEVPPGEEAPTTVAAAGEENPVARYIVEKDGVPMFSAKIDGKQVFIPLDRAQAQLQKHEAAELRLQQAAQLSKHLDERERALRENEQILRQRLAQANTPPSSKDVDDKDLQVQARELVETLFSGTEDEAAEKLANVLRRTRVPVTAPVIDTKELAREAALEARQQIRREQIETDSKEGYTQFSEQYPDILADPYLFKVADGMTDEIAAEHPDWLPSKVMVEAGKRTREWWDRTGKQASVPHQAQAADLDVRQARKAQLVTMPRPATARPVKAPEERIQTPQDVVREMRQARNQPL